MIWEYQYELHCSDANSLEEQMLIHRKENGIHCELNTICIICRWGHTWSEVGPILQSHRAYSLRIVIWPYWFQIISWFGEIPMHCSWCIGIMNLRLFVLCWCSLIAKNIGILIISISVDANWVFMIKSTSFVLFRYQLIVNTRVFLIQSILFEMLWCSFTVNMSVLIWKHILVVLLWC